MKRSSLGALLWASCLSYPLPILASDDAPAPPPPGTTIAPMDRPATAAATIEAPSSSTNPRRPPAVYRPEAGPPSDSSQRGALGEAVVAPITTLQAAIAHAYRTNPQLLAARAQARSADFQVPLARSAYGLSLSVSGDYTFTRARQQVDVTLPDGTTIKPYVGSQGWASGAAAVLNQPLFTSGRNAANEAVARATSEFQRDSLRITEAQVLFNVIQAYVGVLRDATSVSIARNNLALLEQQLEENEMRYRVRDLTLTDLDQTRTRLELGRAQLLQAEGQLGVSQKQFLQFVGAPPGQLAPADAIEVPFASLQDAYAYGEVNSGLNRAAQAREKISRAQVKAAQAEYGPRLDGRGTFSYGSVSPFSDRLRQNQIVGQVVLTQTLFDSGLRSAQVRLAQEANEADWRLLDSTYRDTRQAIGSAWDQLASSRTSLENYQKAIVAAQRAYEGALIQQKSGDRTTLDVLDLARDLLTLRNSYNFAVADEYLARANLLGATGLLEGPKILPGIEAYDADAHFERVRNRSDIPLLTPLLSGIDRIATGDTRSDRPIRDAGAQQALGQSMPLPATMPVPAPAPAP